MRRAEKAVDLTKTEWDLLEYLLRHNGQTLPRQNILEYIWSDDSAVKPELVDVYISYLRKKLNVPGLPIRCKLSVGWATVWMANMLSRLRLRLTLIYLLVGALLVAILGGSTYSVLYYYFQNANDQALQAKLVSVLDGIDVSLPGGLNSAESLDKPERDDDHELHSNEIYEGEQSTIFILPLDFSGELLFNPNPYELPMQPDMDAVAAAQQSGTLDYRNVTLPDGTSARLLTYALPDQAVIDVIQLGKSISGQVSILNQFLTSLLVIGALSIVILGLGSWWIAGRSLASISRLGTTSKLSSPLPATNCAPAHFDPRQCRSRRRRVKMDKKLDAT